MVVCAMVSDEMGPTHFREMELQEARGKLSAAVEGGQDAVETLAQLPKQTQADIVGEYLNVGVDSSRADADAHDDSASASIEPQLDPEAAAQTAGQNEADAEVFLYYDMPHDDIRVATWHQNIEFEWSGDELTRADGRAWHTKTPNGRIHQWELTDESKTEQGGIGENRYRLFTQAKFAMCPGIGPITGCFNELEVWIDMTAHAGGHVDITTSLDKWG